MLENRMSARTKALLLALISLAAAVLFCGQFSGLELLPFGNDYDQAIYQQSTRSPPPPPPDLHRLTHLRMTQAPLSLQ